MYREHSHMWERYRVSLHLLLFFYDFKNMSYPVTDIENGEITTAGGAQFDIKKFVYKLVGFLPFIIISVLVAYTIAQLYLRYTPKMHRVAANLLIKADAESSPDYNLLRELGASPGAREVQNQIDILQSYELS